MNVVAPSLSPSVGPASAPTTLSFSQATAPCATKCSSVDEFPPSLGAAEAQTLLVSFACHVGGIIAGGKEASTFPWETLVINTIGCLAIGVLAGLSDGRGLLGPNARVFLFAGLLGGFTTFSAFGYETFELMRRGQSGGAILSALLHVVLGIGAVWAGHVGARLAGRV